jgi:hypothetical protein
VTQTAIRPHAKVDDFLSGLIPTYDRDWSFASSRLPTGVLAPTRVARPTRHAAELSKAIALTGDAIDDALVQNALAATEVPIADESTVQWLRILDIVGVVASRTIKRSAISDHLRPTESKPVTEPNHTRLARELRDLTGLSAQSLGAAVGVTREQYQRWLAGRPISDMRHGQLIYLHTIAADASRRLGGQAQLWWKTPTESGDTPEAMLAQRLGDAVHRLIATIPDPEPAISGVMVGLPAQMLDDDDDVAGEAADSPPAWSPYGIAQR